MTNAIIVPFGIRKDMDINKQNHKYKHDKKKNKKNSQKGNANSEYDQFDNRSI